MRPYRGIPIDGKDFVYGWYSHVKEHKYRGDENSRITAPEKHFIIQDDSEYLLDHIEPHYVYDLSEAIEVIPETVGQFVKIVKGHKIYTGDIIQDRQDHNYEKWVVMWWPRMAQYVLCNGSPDVEKAAKEDFDLKKGDRVIGNIHQPELIEAVSTTEQK